MYLDVPQTPENLPAEQRGHAGAVAIHSHSFDPCDSASTRKAATAPPADERKHAKAFV